MTYVAAAIGGKWKAHILYLIYEYQVLRYGELRRLLPEVSHKVLDQQLKELIHFNLVERQEYDCMPPKVEYRLTLEGQSTLPILKAMYEWGKAQLD